LFKAAPVEAVTAAAAGGFDAVGMRVAGRQPGDGSTSVIGNAAAVRDIRRRRDDAGIAITHVTAYWVTRDLPLSAFLPVIETAAELGAGMIGVNCGDPDEDRFVSFMARYCEAAARYRLKLALEFMPYSDAKTLQQAARMVRRAAQPNFGLMIDPLHLARSGGTPADVQRVEPGLIYMVQLCDAPLEKPAALELRSEALGNRLYPGEGGLPLYDLLDAVPPEAQIDVEIPCRQHADLAPDEQGRLTGEKCRRFLAAYFSERRRPATASDRPPHL
jgi:sugar phosphate isomerase/epimerase